MVLRIVARMSALGLTEALGIYGYQTSTGNIYGSASRERVLLGTVVGVVWVGGGTLQAELAGANVSASHLASFPSAATIQEDGVTLASSLLRADNIHERWLKRANDNRWWHIQALDVFGPYVQLAIDTGGTADAAGRPR